MGSESLFDLFNSHSGKVSDKWELYLREYDRLFLDFRDKTFRLLEIGVQNGGSLEIWAKYFPNAAAIVGCDIDPLVGALTYDDPRISVVVGDAAQDATVATIVAHAPQFDIIIDDGSHRSS